MMIEFNDGIDEPELSSNLDEQDFGFKESYIYVATQVLAYQAFRHSWLLQEGKEPNGIQKYTVRSEIDAEL